MTPTWKIFLECSKTWNKYIKKNFPPSVPTKLGLSTICEIFPCVESYYDRSKIFYVQVSKHLGRFAIFLQILKMRNYFILKEERSYFLAKGFSPTGTEQKVSPPQKIKCLECSKTWNKYIKKFPLSVPTKLGLSTICEILNRREAICLWNTEHVTHVLTNF